MKKTIKLLGITTIAVVMAFTFAALSLTSCDDGTTNGGGTYTITFDANGGTVTPAYATTGTDGKLSSLPTPTRSSYTFTAWYTAMVGGTEVTTSTVFGSDTIIYAQWASGSPNLSLEGVWRRGSDANYVYVSISGSTGVFTHIANFNAVWNDAVNKGYVKVGDPYYRNLTKTGDLTWTGQVLLVQSYNSSPNVAIGTSWASVTITLNADGQTFTDGATWTRVTTPTLEGVWRRGSDANYVDVSISGSTGVFTHIANLNAVWNDAVNKGYVKVGDPYYRNLTKTGDLTWTGQVLQVQSYNSSPNVAIGTSWASVTITLNADGQTFTDGATWTRQ